VSLIPLERNEKVSFNHPNILPIYAEVSLNERRFVLSDEYKNCSLRNLLEEFGPFREALGRQYLRQIALGLQHMHYYRRAHNRLSLTAILYNQNGELFINAVRATSFVPSREELASGKEIIHTFAPEFLLSKGFSKSLNNDVWGLGCLAILMLTSTGLSQSPFNPYSIDKFKSEEEAQMIDNIRQLHPTSFAETRTEERIYKNSHNHPGRLSDAAASFISSCLKPLAEERPSI
jgi:serine/threonine protein kinase